MVLFLVITLIPIIIFEIMTYNIYNNTILDNATEFSVGTINQTSNEIEVVLQDLQDLVLHKVFLQDGIDSSIDILKSHLCGMLLVEGVIKHIPHQNF